MTDEATQESSREEVTARKLEALADAHGRTTTAIVMREAAALLLEPLFPETESAPQSACDPETGQTYWEGLVVHNAMDCREVVEEAERILEEENGGC